MRIAIKFAYDGKFFHGFARQPDLKTVEGDLINALVKQNIIKDLNESFFRIGSRTDKGVSALGNVVAFNTNFFKKDIIKNLSDELENILIYGYAEVDSDFNPRYAKYRHYRYFLKNDGFDFEKLIDAANVFTGKHNFSNFARVESFKDPVRTIDNIVFSEENNIIIIDFFAQTFLWHQIRRIVSSLEKIGMGKIEKDQIINALNNPKEKFDFGLAPAEPLILQDVIYDFQFEKDINLFNKLKKMNNKLLKNLF